VRVSGEHHEVVRASSGGDLQVRDRYGATSGAEGGSQTAEFYGGTVVEAALIPADQVGDDTLQGRAEARATPTATFWRGNWVKGRKRDSGVCVRRLPS